MNYIAITTRQARLAILFLQGFTAVAALIFALFMRSTEPVTIGAIIAVLLFAGFIVGYIRGLEWTIPASLVVTTVLDATVLVFDRPDVGFSPAFFIPPVMALMLVGARGIALTGVTMLATVIVALPGDDNPYTTPIRLVISVLIIGGMVIARLVLDTATRRLEATLHQTQAAQHQAEAAAETARVQATQLQQQYDEQQRLMNLVATLEIPVISLAEGVILVPIVGSIDSRRAERLTASLLQTITTRRTRFVILDLAGVVEVDTFVARAIMNLVHAIKLMGCRVALTGISTTVAMTLTNLNIQLEGMMIIRTPQQALETYLGQQTVLHRGN
jgi:anti-anti-sigma regulatory factor